MEAAVADELWAEFLAVVASPKGGKAKTARPLDAVVGQLVATPTGRHRLGKELSNKGPVSKKTRLFRAVIAHLPPSSTGLDQADRMSWQELLRHTARACGESGLGKKSDEYWQLLTAYVRSGSPAAGRDVATEFGLIRSDFSKMPITAALRQVDGWVRLDTAAKLDLLTAAIKLIEPIDFAAEVARHRDALATPKAAPAPEKPAAQPAAQPPASIPQDAVADPPMAASPAAAVEPAPVLPDTVSAAADTVPPEAAAKPARPKVTAPGLTLRVEQVEKSLADLLDLREKMAALAERLTELEAARDDRHKLGAALATATAERDDLRRQADAAAERVAAARREAQEQAERRADLNIHRARQDRDQAVDSFRAELWAAVGPYLSIVSEASPGEAFATTREEVLTLTLREVRDALRKAGVPPG